MYRIEVDPKRGGVIKSLVSKLGGKREIVQKDAYNNPERTIYDEKYRMNIYFPAALKNPELYKQAPFDVCRSEQESTRFSNWNDIKHNVILGWVDLEDAEGNGFALFSDHTTAYAYGETPLALTVQASGNGLWGRNYMIDGPTELSFSILPHRSGDWEEPALEYNRWTEPLVCSFQKAVGVESVAEVVLQGKVLREIPLEKGVRGGMNSFSADLPSLGFKTYLLRKGKD